MIGAPKKATMDWFSQTLSQWLRNRQTLSNWARFHGWEGKSPKQDVRTRFITWSKSKIHQGPAQTTREQSVWFVAADLMFTGSA